MSYQTKTLKLPASYDAAKEITSPEDSYTKYKLAFTALQAAKGHAAAAEYELFSGANAQLIRRLTYTKSSNSAAKRDKERQLEEAYAISHGLDSARNTAQREYGTALGNHRVSVEAGEIHFKQNEAEYHQEALDDFAATELANDTDQAPPEHPIHPER